MPAPRCVGIGLACVAAIASFANSAAAATSDAPPVVLAQAGPPGAAKTVVFSESDAAGKIVATGADGLLQVLLSDGTTLTLGPNSEVRIDSFTFDPASNSATLAATLTRGAFRLIGGVTTKTAGGVSLGTPYGTLTVEGAGVDISLGGAEGEAHFDMVFGTGSIALSRGNSEIARVRRAGYSIVPSASAASVRKTPPEWRQAMQDVLTWRALDGVTFAMQVFAAGEQKILK